MQELNPQEKKRKNATHKGAENILGYIVYTITFIIALSALIVFLNVQKFVQNGPLTEEVLVDIPHGSSLSYIAEKLHHEGIIDDVFLFKIGARLTNQGKHLKAGEYEIPAQANMQQVLNIIKSGKSHQRFITIPEGLTSYEIVNLLNDNAKLSGSTITDIPPEGSLLPETYSYDKTHDRSDILDHMREAMEKINRPTNIELCNILSITDPEKCWHSVITLASIVEKETSIPAERQTVAGVFFNRLRRGIALQTDPTVIYAITKGEHKNDGRGPLGRRLLRKDLEFDSPYNTYKYAGLPPGPIANPGLDSIKAVLEPEHHDFIYFVANGDGGHAFAKTLDEHNNNAANWRKIRDTKPATEEKLEPAPATNASPAAPTQEQEQEQEQEPETKTETPLTTPGANTKASNQE